MIRFIVVAVALLFSSFSFSANYFWAGNNPTDTPSPSPSVFFNSIGSQIQGLYKFTVTNIRKVSNVHYKAEINRYYNETAVSSFTADSYRYGDSCAPGSIYNTTTGVCDAPACPVGEARNAQNVCAPIVCPVVNESIESVYSPKQTKCVLYPNLDNEEACGFLNGKSSGSSVITVSSNSAEGPKGVTDEPNYCGLTVTKAECTSKINPSPESLSKGSYTCKVSGIYTGAYLPENTTTPDGFCPGGTCTEPPPPNPEPPVPVPANTHDEKPCVYTVVGGVKTCTSSKVKSKEGTAQCVTVNGNWVCATSLPSHNGIDIQSKVETSLDGTFTNTTKTDTATVTSCKNIGDCKVTQTVTKTTTRTDGNGATTSVTGTCTGPSCPTKNGNPDADGDGFGDCTSDCGEGEGEGEGNASSSGDCKVPPPCDGDPFQCAILKQSWLNSCLERALPTTEEKAAMDNLIDQAHADNDQAQGVLDSKVTGLMNGLKTAGSGNISNGSGPCLPDYPISFLGKTIVMEFSALCPYLAIFRFGLLFIAYLGAARIVSTQL